MRHSLIIRQAKSQSSLVCQRFQTANQSVGLVEDSTLSDLMENCSTLFCVEMLATNQYALPDTTIEVAETWTTENSKTLSNSYTSTEISIIKIL